MIVENLLSSRVKIKILRFFFEYPLVKRNVREIAMECKVGFGIAANTLKDLKNLGIIRMERNGREMIYSLNTTSEFFEPLRRIFEIEKTRLAGLPFLYRSLLGDIVASTKTFADLCLLFGSLVTGSYTPRSDVDLFFISSREEKLREICLGIEDKYGIKLQVVVIRKKDIRKFKRSSLYKTIKKESLLLFGEEKIRDE